MSVENGLGGCLDWETALDETAVFFSGKKDVFYSVFTWARSITTQKQPSKTKSTFSWEYVLKYILKKSHSIGVA